MLSLRPIKKLPQVQCKKKIGNETVHLKKCLVVFDSVDDERLFATIVLVSTELRM